MQIGQLSAATGVPARTIRFYEDKGILPEPDRTPTGYRIYDSDAVNRLRFLRRAQKAGLTLGEIRSVVTIRDNGEAPCSHTRSLLEAKKREVAQRLHELEELQSELDRLTGSELAPEQCAPDDICSIITTERKRAARRAVGPPAGGTGGRSGPPRGAASASERVSRAKT